jgi:hypothetical protein
MRLTKEQQQYVKELSLANGGVITPDLIIKDAKRKKSPLHECFNWDVNKAAMEHWLGVARNIISSVQVTVTEHTVVFPTPAYVEDPDKPKGTQGYVSTITLRSNKDKARRALIRELERAEAFMQRAYNVAAAVGLSNEIEALLAQIRSIARSA